MKKLIPKKPLLFFILVLGFFGVMALDWVIATEYNVYMHAGVIESIYLISAIIGYAYYDEKKED